ncbi:4Fe-4S single cluster domain-containing protein [Paenibacillus cymbidii]|uniref:4Fe-4S single cluster domain-containing protein n=1 Tax=Paenibacillus cymbidii TaxID=1639034 RepID=UPI001081BCE3|nr:4Fe-4S single cluster domain-containing protein [Paenibacillus cymbidii]
MPSIYVHEINPHSAVNGPGRRAVVWVQGCSLGCPGCFNPQTHPGSPVGTPYDPDELGETLALPDLDGLTVSGGEPLEQAEATGALIRAFRRKHNGTVLLFTGMTVERILTSPTARETILGADAVLSGPYVAHAESTAIWHHKRLLQITGRIPPDALIPERRLEIGINRQGRIHLTGYPDSERLQMLTSLLGKEKAARDKR